MKEDGGEEVEEGGEGRGERGRVAKVNLPRNNQLHNITEVFDFRFAKSVLRVWVQVKKVELPAISSPAAHAIPSRHYMGA